MQFFSDSHNVTLYKYKITAERGGIIARRAWIRRRRRRHYHLKRERFTSVVHDLQGPRPSLDGVVTQSV